MTGELIPDRIMPVIQIDSTGTHYFKSMRECKDWYAMLQINRVDAGGYFDADDYTGDIIPVDCATKQSLNIGGAMFIFKTESNAKTWITKQKQYPTATG